MRMSRPEDVNEHGIITNALDELTSVDAHIREFWYQPVLSNRLTDETTGGESCAVPRGQGPSPPFTTPIQLLRASPTLQGFVFFDT